MMEDNLSACYLLQIAFPARLYWIVWITPLGRMAIDYQLLNRKYPTAEVCHAASVASIALDGVVILANAPCEGIAHICLYGPASS